VLFVKHKNPACAGLPEETRDGWKIAYTASLSEIRVRQGKRQDFRGRRI
jgi:hypothetical protein